LKTLAALLLAFAIAASLSACDSTSPSTVTVHDTTIVYYNDPFAKTSALVHGQWRLVSGTDTATATLFQDTSSVSATIQWKDGTIWMLQSTRLTKDSLALANPTRTLYLWAKFTDTANHKITGMSGTYFNVDKPSAGTPAWTGERTL